MRRRLPSLNGLKAFESAARHESFTRAAAELFVTPGAVSQQVKGLEDELGLKLFTRARQRLHLTEAGRGYLEVVRDAMDRLAEGTERLRARATAGVLNVTTSPNFAAKWLVHRLGRFAVRHPEIDLRVSASLQHVDFARDDFDMAIRHGDGRWSGLDAVELCAEKLFPVAAPGYVGAAGGLAAPADLAHARLLHTNDTRDWQTWLAAAGAAQVDATKGPVFNQASMAIDAAIDGQGVALARSALAAWDLLAGRLVKPFPLALKVDYGYWIVAPRATAAKPKIATFRAWLMAEAAEDARRLRGASKPAPSAVPAPTPSAVPAPRERGG